MVVGTIFLLTILFGGGLIDTFFVAELEKGVKEYVVGDERQKEILSDLKMSKSALKTFNKNRKEQFKAYKKLSSSRATTGEELNDFFLALREERLELQRQLVDARLDLAQKIQPEEWVSIIALSEESIAENAEKAQKKADKKLAKSQGYTETIQEEVFFEKTRKSLAQSITDSDKQTTITNGLDEVVVEFQKLERRLRSINVTENIVISNRDSTREDLDSIAIETNELRSLGFEALFRFHFLIRENTTEPEWDKLIKAFHKDLDLAIR
ncbi:MAG: hypothetical protein V7754_05790 [Halioglobus sp.]